MNREPRYLMTRKDIAKFVDYVNKGATEDSKALYLHQFKYREDTEQAIKWEDVKHRMKVYHRVPKEVDE